MEAERKQERHLHYTMSFVGGIFALYSLLEHANVFGSAETSNMILLVKDLLNFDLFHILIRIFSLLIYICGIVTALWMAKHHPHIQKRLCLAIDVFTALILGLLPENIHPVIALYPVAFAMSVQWCTFRGVKDNPSATTFSTGNLRQLVTHIFNYVTERKPNELSCARFYAFTMLSFHAGIAAIYIVWSYFPHKSIWLVYIPLTLAFIQEILLAIKKGIQPQLLPQNSGCEEI